MDPQAKRTLTAIFLCLLILVGWLKVQEILYPPSPQAATSGPAEEFAASSEPEEAPATQASAGTVSSQPGPTATAASNLQVTNALDAGSVLLGDARPDDKASGFKNPYEFAVSVSGRGAAVESVRLSRYRNKLSKDKRHPTPDPYDLVSSLEDDAGHRWLSLACLKLRLVEDKLDVDLENTIWALDKHTDDRGETAVLTTTVRRADQDVLRLRKTYRVNKGAHDLAMSLDVENLSREPRKVIVFERGPIGFKNEDPQRECRRISTAVTDDAGAFAVGETHMRSDIFGQEEHQKEFRIAEGKHLYWTAIGNKYFGCILTPQPLAADSAKYADYVAKVVGRTYIDDKHATDDLSRPSDLTFETAYAPVHPIAPGQTLSLRFDAYCGPKSDSLFESLPDAVARHYSLVSNPDRSGCTFHPLTVGMLWLLTRLYGIVGNYGVAIIILVFIVRLILHPVTKYGQVNMMKMQKAQARLKPKMDALSEQYKNDRKKLNEEMMKLQREEGVNPASGILGCLPMLLQMPIWVALWTTLNTNVDMRHKPFFWWINDLSSPDALYQPDPPWNLYIPLIGSMTGIIRGFNLLPIIMTITMYAQQKFSQKMAQPAVPLPPKLDAEGRPIPDPMAQQQKMMGFMMFIFGFMFYNFPSGLNLYILTSNLLGMYEQYRIKKHIREQEERGGFEGGAGPSKPRTPRDKPSLLERLQNRMEEARQAQAGRANDRTSKKRKQLRR